MTDLEKRVAELRAKYEEPIRKYYGAYRTYQEACVNTPLEDYDRIIKLYERCERLFPIGAISAAGSAVKHMDNIDSGLEPTELGKELLASWIERWATDMEEVEI